MDGMLSQDEINALLSGMDIGESGGLDAPLDENLQAKVDAHNEMVADAMANPQELADARSAEEATLSDIEKDAIGEVANISMGSSATTLYSLVNRKVNITTPTVSLATWENVIDDYEKPCVFIQIKYTVGLEGNNILVLREHDVKVITDLMMGGDGTNIDGELGELHLSAISEAMNQMMGASATSLSSMLGKMIDISPPEASLVDLTAYKSGADISPFLGGTFVKIAFRMQIDDLVDSTLMQLYPVDFAKTLYEKFIEQQMGGGAAEEPAAAAPAPAVAPAAAPEAAPQGQPAMQPDYGMQGGYGMPPQGYGMPPQGYPMPPQGYGYGMPQQPMQNVQAAQFQSFSGDYAPAPVPANIGLISDVPLEVTVELGRTKKAISDILDFAPGTIIELDKVAGEPVDVIVNGKLVAKGEVVVIEESFGVRVTEIIG
ncbi:MAG: flagellar motor switch phosphatase FliY [Lachnospiraceae bacterium]|nr:flagellar motor switch phosphatase FliY [Lachnospiraceae bacterium]